MTNEVNFNEKYSGTDANGKKVDLRNISIVTHAGIKHSDKKREALKSRNLNTVRGVTRYSRVLRADGKEPSEAPHTLTFVNKEGVATGAVSMAVTRVTRHLITSPTGQATDLINQIKSALTVRMTAVTTDETGKQRLVTREVPQSDFQIEGFDPAKECIEQNDVRVVVSDPVLRRLWAKDPIVSRAIAGNDGVTFKVNGQEVTDLTLRANLGGFFSFLSRGFTWVKKAIGAAIETSHELGITWFETDKAGNLRQVIVGHEHENRPDTPPLIAPFPGAACAIVDADAEEIQSRFGVSIPIEAYDTMEEFVSARNLSEAELRGFWDFVKKAVPWIQTFVKKLSDIDFAPENGADIELGPNDVDYRNQPYPISPEDFTNAMLDMSTDGHKHGQLIMPLFAPGSSNSETPNTTISIDPSYGVGFDKPDALTWELSSDFEYSGGTEESVKVYMHNAEFDWSRYGFNLCTASGVAMEPNLGNLAVTGFDTSEPCETVRTATVTATMQDGRTLSCGIPYIVRSEKPINALLVDSLVKTIGYKSEIDPMWLVAVVSDSESIIDDVGNLCTLSPDKLVLDYAWDEENCPETLPVRVSLAEYPDMYSEVVFNVRDLRGVKDDEARVFGNVDARFTHSASTALKDIPVGKCTTVMADGTYYFSPAEAIVRENALVSTTEVLHPGKYTFGIIPSGDTAPIVPAKWMRIEIEDPIVFMYVKLESSILKKGESPKVEFVTMRRMSGDVVTEPYYDMHGFVPDVAGMQVITFRCTAPGYQHIECTRHVYVTENPDSDIIGIDIKDWDLIDENGNIPLVSVTSVPYAPIPVGANILIKHADGKVVIGHSDMLELRTSIAENNNQIIYSLNTNNVAKSDDWYIRFNSAKSHTKAQKSTTVYAIGKTPRNVSCELENGKNIYFAITDAWNFDPMVAGKYTAGVYLATGFFSENVPFVFEPVDVASTTITPLFDTVSPGYDFSVLDFEITDTLVDGRKLRSRGNGAVITANLIEGSDTTMVHYVGPNGVGAGALVRISNEEMCVYDAEEALKGILVVEPKMHWISEDYVITQDSIPKLVEKAYIQYSDGTTTPVKLDGLEIINLESLDPTGRKYIEVKFGVKSQ